MTTPLTSPLAAFGQTVGYAERTLTATLRRHLAKRGIAPETWFALKLIAAGGPGMGRQALSTELEGSRTLTPDSVRELLVRLDAEGLIRGSSAIDLTAAGEDLFRSLRDYVTGLTAGLLSQFPAEDIETTVRTLQAITERAAEELAAGD